MNASSRAPLSTPSMPCSVNPTLWSVTRPCKECMKPSSAAACLAKRVPRRCLRGVLHAGRLPRGHKPRLFLRPGCMPQQDPAWLISRLTPSLRLLQRREGREAGPIVMQSEHVHPVGSYNRVRGSAKTLNSAPGGSCRCGCARSGRLSRSGRGAAATRPRACAGAPPRRCVRAAPSSPSPCSCAASARPAPGDSAGGMSMCTHVSPPVALQGGHMPTPGLACIAAPCMHNRLCGCARGLIKKRGACISRMAVRATAPACIPASA